jgi:hypothetical protein
MRERALGKTGLRLTELGFGAAGLGNLYRETTDRDADEAIDAAWELGIRYFDTAPHYGLGLSERRLGRALRKYPRDQYVVSTKVGRLLVPNHNKTGRDNDGFVHSPTASTALGSIASISCTPTTPTNQGRMTDCGWLHSSSNCVSRAWSARSASARTAARRRRGFSPERTSI